MTKGVCHYGAESDKSVFEIYLLSDYFFLVH